MQSQPSAQCQCCLRLLSPRTLELRATHGDKHPRASVPESSATCGSSSASTALRGGGWGSQTHWEGDLRSGCRSAACVVRIPGRFRCPRPTGNPAGRGGGGQQDRGCGFPGTCWKALPATRSPAADLPVGKIAPPCRALMGDLFLERLQLGACDWRGWPAAGSRREGRGPGRPLPPHLRPLVRRRHADGWVGRCAASRGCSLSIQN